ncbi:MAG: hypothetical protein SGI90_15475 [Candidatus Eisenbacteria bacterium]|nr:hypothetical protein [Candidatus Eisenbacteria bacterium]
MSPGPLTGQLRRWRHATGVFAAAGILGLASLAGAVETKQWFTSGREAFLAATLESLSVSSEGIVRVAPALEPVSGIEVAYVWSLLSDPSGSVWAGTGNSGEIFRIDGLAALRIHDPVALQVESMAIDPKGGVLVGTAPDGTILSVGKDGVAETRVDLPSQHVWGFGIDTAGRLLLATGEPARLYRVDQRGEATLIFEADADHFTALVLDGDVIYLGDDRKGLIWRIDENGQARILYDAAEVEVRALSIGADGSIYAAVNRDIAETLGATSGTAAASGGGTSTVVGTGTRREGSTTAVGPAVYRIRPDGAVESLWTCPDATIQAMIEGPDGSLLIGTGGLAGGIYRLEPTTRDWSLLSRPKAPQVLALARVGDTLYLATGAPGRVYRAGLTGSPVGKLLSIVHDARQVSDWGVVRWDHEKAPGGQLTVRTRTGNTAVPDDTWSPWSAPLSDATGSPIASPAARFVQWEAILARGAALSGVTLTWAEKNLPPTITRVTVSAAGAALQRGGDSGGPQPVVQALPGNVRAEFSVTTQGSRREANDEEASWARRYRTIRWEAADPNDDVLRYRLDYRARGESEWRLLEAKLTDPIYVLDTTRLPDGEWGVRVSALDAPDNSPGEELDALRESEFFLVDNAPPVIEALTVTSRGDSISVDARFRDSAGPLKEAEFSLDGSDWRRMLPLDRVWDERSEEVRVTLARPVTEGGDLLIRAYDGNGNKGVGRQPLPAAAGNR